MVRSNPMPDTKSFSELTEFIRSETDRHLLKLDIPEEPKYLYDPIRYTIKGKGKRLRPILVHLSGRGFNADPEDLMRAGMAVELLHNFTLVHDDIMDHDDLRHGQPSVHKKFNEAAAILAGDTLFTLAQLMISQVKTNTLIAAEAFNESSLAVCEGQAFDLQFEKDTTITLEKYLKMVELKTGALISLCSELGGILGNRKGEVLSSLRKYGNNLGKAFQIQDDMLEITQDERSLGKSTASDIQSEKQTILTVLARQKEGWQEVDSMTGNMELKRNKRREFFENSGVMNDANKLHELFIQKAKESLKVFAGIHRENMEQFTDWILNRTY